MWHLKTATEHARAVRAGEVTSLALVEHYVRRIEALDLLEGTNAVVVRSFEQARQRAREAEKGHISHPRGASRQAVWAHKPPAGSQSSGRVGT